MKAGSTNASVSVNVSECLGVTEIAGNELRVYPNPSDGILYIRSETGGRFSLTNDLGQILGSFDVQTGKEHKIHGLASGAYFVIGEAVRKPVRVIVFSNP